MLQINTLKETNSKNNAGSINDSSKDNSWMLETFGETIYDMSVVRKITQQDSWSDAQPEELVRKLHGQGGRDIAGKTHDENFLTSNHDLQQGSRKCGLHK